jgi:hypothetical protein
MEIQFSGLLRAASGACLMAATLLQPALADVPVFQSVPDLGNAAGISQVGWCSSCDGMFRIYDQFTLGSATTLSGFTVSLFEDPLYWPNDVNFSVWTVEGGMPGAELFSQTISAGDFSTVAVPGAPALLATTSALTGASFDAGTYYVSFYNPGRLAVNGYLGGGGNLYQAGNTFHVGTSAGFILYAPVPEPGAVAMMLLGLGVVGSAAARRRN